MPTRIYRAGIWANPGGYTLIELAIVVLILALSVGLLMPRFSDGLFVSDRKLSIRRLAAAVSEARNSAMIAGTNQTLVLDFGQESGASCWWIEQTEPEPAEEAVVREPRKSCLPGGMKLTRVQKSDGKLFESGRVPLLFLPNGLTEPAFLQLGREGEVTTLVVKPFNARLEVRAGSLGTPGTDQEFMDQ